MQHLEGSGTPVVYIGRKVLKGYSQSALHVSGDVFAHHQEHFTVFTVSGIYIYIYIHTHTHTCVCVCLYVYIYIYTYIYVNKKVQLDAAVCRNLFTAKSLYMFRVSQHPSSGALKIVTATSGIGHNTGTATSFQRGLIRSPDQTTLEEVAVPVL